LRTVAGARLVDAFDALEPVAQTTSADVHIGRTAGHNAATFLHPRPPASLVVSQQPVTDFLSQTTGATNVR